MASTPALRVAIVGYGMAGADFHAPIIAATPGMSVAGIVTGNAARQARARADYPAARIFSSADELWASASDFGLVVVAAPNRAHVALGLAAIAAGLPVVIDKPLAPSVEEGERVVAAAREHGVPLTVYQNRRWDADFRTVRALIDAGALGEVLRFESRYERWRPEPKVDSWREDPDPQQAGGLLFDLGPHLIDQALVLFGEPESVYAEVMTRRPGARVDDDVFVALSFPGGARAHLWASAVARTQGPRFRALGTRGAYEKWGMDPQEEHLRAGERPYSETFGEESREQGGRLETEVGAARDRAGSALPLDVDGKVRSLPGDYREFYAQLRDALTAGAPLPVDPADALRTLRVIAAAQRSARDGVVVRWQ